MPGVYFELESCASGDRSLVTNYSRFSSANLEKCLSTQETTEFCTFIPRETGNITKLIYQMVAEYQSPVFSAADDEEEEKLSAETQATKRKSYFDQPKKIQSDIEFFAYLVATKQVEKETIIDFLEEGLCPDDKNLILTLAHKNKIITYAQYVALQSPGGAPKATEGETLERSDKKLANHVRN